MTQRQYTRAVRRSRWGKHRGSALVEFALVVPVLLALLVGIMEFGWLVYTNLVMSNAVREAARAASLGRTTTVVTNMINTRCRPLTVTTTIQYSLKGSAYVNVTNNGSVNAAPTASLIRVTSTAGYRTLTGLIPGLKNRSVQVYAEFGRE
jgi:Flp pilus assembly protein TadG